MHVDPPHACIHLPPSIHPSAHSYSLFIAQPLCG
jgi:hypothetical protein